MLYLIYHFMNNHAIISLCSAGSLADGVIGRSLAVIIERRRKMNSIQELVEQLSKDEKLSKSVNDALSGNKSIYDVLKDNGINASQADVEAFAKSVQEGNIKIDGVDTNALLKSAQEGLAGLDTAALAKEGQKLANAAAPFVSNLLKSAGLNKK